MGVLNFLKDLGGAAAEAYKAKVEAKNRLELAKLESEIAAERQWQEWRVANISADAAWEQAQITNSGWKDEWVLLILSTPLIMVFVPPLTPYVTLGFESLAATPEWYRWTVMTVFLAIYGVRLWRRPVS